MKWRLLGLTTADGAMNMAIDEALLLSVAAGGQPVLRFYQWKRPCISIGYSQKTTTIDREACQQNEWDVVRRLTGGRAVLHHNELTYMLCVPDTEQSMAGGVIASYQRISRGLAAGLTQMHVALDTVCPSTRVDQQQSPACFDATSACEITFRGRKLIGSAQTRRKGVILQHGSLPLKGDMGEIVDGLSLQNRDKQLLRRNLRQQSAALAYAVSGDSFHPDDVAYHLQDGLKKELSLSFIPSSLTADEQHLSQQLYNQKYTQMDWND